MILAGGRGSRLHGRDKGLIRYQGQPLYQHQINRLRPQVAEIIINANRNRERYARSGLRVVSDVMDNFQGPLAGMLTALDAIDHPWLATVPCDGPYIAADYVSRMRQATVQQQVKLAVATDGQRQQPVYLLIHRDLRHSLRDFLASGERKIDRWFADAPYVDVGFADCVRMFTNINTRVELEQLRREP